MMNNPFSKQDNPVDFDPLADFPGQERKSQGNIEKRPRQTIGQFWQSLSQTGVVEPALRIGTILLSTILVVFVVWSMRNYLDNPAIQGFSLKEGDAQAAQSSIPTPITPRSATSCSAMRSW